jgi:hypothetical protein
MMHSLKGRRLSLSSLARYISGLASKFAASNFWSTKLTCRFFSDRFA